MKALNMVVRALAPAALLCCLGLAAQPAHAQQTFSFPNFNSTTGLKVNGTAGPVLVGNANVLRITPNQGNSVGSVWYTSNVPLQAGFTTTFTFQFTKQGGSGGHADGIAFVVQHSSTGINYLDSNFGGSLGYGDDDGDDNPGSGISNSLAIEFDTFTNGWDPNNNHVAIQSCFEANNSQHHNGTCATGSRQGSSPTLAINSALSSLNIDINDGAAHTAIITYAPPCANCQNLTVLLDGQKVATAALDIASLGLDATDDAFVGFTGSTGGGFENQDIVSWSFSAQTITQPVTQNAPTNFAFSNANGAELVHTVDFTPPAGQLVYPNNDAGTIQIQSTNTAIDANTWPQYVVGGPFAPSLLFPIVQDNPNGTGTNGALFVDLCFDPTLTGSAATPSDANCPFSPNDPNVPLLGIDVVADLVAKPGITPGTTTALAHYEPTAPSTAPWAPSTGNSNPACVTTTGATGGTQPAPPTACNVFDAQNQISGDQTTSSGRVRSKGTFAMINGVPMLLSAVTVNGTPVNQPPANSSAYIPLSANLWFSKPLNLGFTVNPACIPGQCPTTVASLANNFFNPAPVAGESFDILQGNSTVVATTPATPAPGFDTASPRPISFSAQESLADGQYTLEWSAVDNVGILEQNQNLVSQAMGPCPGADPSAQGTQCYITTLFNAPLNVDSTPPVIASANAGQTYKAGQKNVVANFTCTDPTPGAGTASCTGNGGAANLDTTPTGGVLTTKTFSVTGTDKAIPPNSITTPFTYFVSCNYAAVTLKPSTISKTKLPTLIGITASVTDCMTASQKVVVNFSVSGPIGKNCAAGSQSLFSTPAFTIKSGTANSVTFPFPILKGACAGTYTVTTTTTVQGSNQPPDVVPTTLTITN